MQHRPLTPWKTWYSGPNFRYEKPQRGRYRQFDQVGIAVGTEQAADEGSAAGAGQDGRQQALLQQGPYHADVEIEQRSQPLIMNALRPKQWSARPATSWSSRR